MRTTVGMGLIALSLLVWSPETAASSCQKSCKNDVVACRRTQCGLILSSGCDPLGTNPAGEQLFAVRPDGAGLRQITHARGVVTDTPDVFEVELPGPFAYQ